MRRLVLGFVAAEFIGFAPHRRDGFFSKSLNLKIIIDDPARVTPNEPFTPFDNVAQIEPVPVYEALCVAEVCVMVASAWGLSSRVWRA